MIEFVFMLTHDDATVANAPEVIGELRNSGLRYVGFKDVGVSQTVLKDVADAAHEAGMTVMLEIVTTEFADELNSLNGALELGVDWVLGGTHPEAGVDVFKGTQIVYCPFAGIVEGHPSVLRGSQERIAEHARELSATEGVFGVDLLAYRHPNLDPLTLTRAVVGAVDGPVIVAGSVATAQQISDLEATGAWGFTIGGAIFEGRLPGGPTVAGQVSAVLELAVEAA